MTHRASLAVVGALALFAAHPTLADAPVDPLASPLWSAYAASVLGNAPVVFDAEVKLDLPLVTENQHEFPVTVDARTLGRVDRIVVFSDLNPIPIAIDYRPVRALAFVALRIKLDQKTPVRAAVLTKDGVWHLAGQWVDAAGGGCSAPPVSRVRGDWADHLGELRGALWREAGGTRLRFALRHPMDTGFVDNIPAYNLEQVKVTDAAGAVLATMEVNASVGEDPAFTLMLQADGLAQVGLDLADTNGRRFTGTVALAGGIGS